MENKKAEPQKTQRSTQSAGHGHATKYFPALRAEQKDLGQMNALLKKAKLSRNDLIFLG